MSGARERILGRVRAATESLPERTPMPDASELRIARSRSAPAPENLDTRVAAFCERWRDASGRLLRSPAELAAFLQEQGATAGYVDPELLPLLGDGPWSSAAGEYHRSRLDELGYGVTRASFGIAETGTIALTDEATPNRLAALAPWIHIAVLRKDDIRATLAEGCEALGDDPCVILVTGPSKTADIEGVLVEGAHGPGVQAVLLT